MPATSFSQSLSYLAIIREMRLTLFILDESCFSSSTRRHRVKNTPRIKSFWHRLAKRGAALLLYSCSKRGGVVTVLVFKVSPDGVVAGLLWAQHCCWEARTGVLRALLHPFAVLAPPGGLPHSISHNSISFKRIKRYPGTVKALPHSILHNPNSLNDASNILRDVHGGTHVGSETTS